MQIKHPSNLYENLKGLPGLEDRLYHGNNTELTEPMESKKSTTKWTILTFIILSISAFFLPLSKLDQSTEFLKVYYIGLSVNLQEHAAMHLSPKR